jgi:hypothetical protein
MYYVEITPSYYLSTFSGHLGNNCNMLCKQAAIFPYSMTRDTKSDAAQPVRVLQAAVTALVWLS